MVELSGSGVVIRRVPEATERVSIHLGSVTTSIGVSAEGRRAVLDPIG